MKQYNIFSLRLIHVWNQDQEEPESLKVVVFLSPFSLFFFCHGKFPAAGGMPCSYSDACVHVGICENLNKEGLCWQRGHNQALNG